MTLINDCNLLLGDTMRELPLMIQGGFRADCIVTDPPYKLTSGGSNSGELSGCLHNSYYANNGEIVDCDIDWPDFMPLLYAALKDECHAYVMANNRNVQAMLNAADAAGFGFHNLLVWDKITATPNRWYMKNCEYIGFFYKGRAKYINDCSSMQMIRCPQIDVSGHPTEKPVALMQHYIENSSRRDELIFDPFAGSFTTAIAAIRAKRIFIGIEKNDNFFNMGLKRVKDEYANMQPDMFNH